MIRLLAFVVMAVSTFCFVQNVAAQGSTMDPGESGGSTLPIDESPLPGLDDDDDDTQGIGRIPITLRVSLSQLTEDANHHAILCELKSSLLGDDKNVAWGFVYLTRDSQELRRNLTEMGVRALRDDELIHFTGDSFDRSITVNATATAREDRAAPGTVDDIPYEWTHGECYLAIHAPTFALGGRPADCMSNPSTDAGPVQINACVWPGTRPEDAAIRFTRPGLPNPNNEQGR